MRFRPLVERLYHEAGARVFVQMGIGSLTGFVDDTLGDRDHAAVAGAGAAKRSALAQVQRALTALWVEGLDLRPDALALPRPVATEPPRQPAARARGRWRHRPRSRGRLPPPAVAGASAAPRRHRCRYIAGGAAWSRPPPGPARM